MKKYVIVLFVVFAFIAYLLVSKRGSVLQHTAMSYVSKTSYINEVGATISERVIVPDGFSRSTYATGSFQNYIQDYGLKEFGSKVINYDGSEYGYQSGHVGILEIPVPSNGLQQCADALIRIRSEFLWEQQRQDEIRFNFTSGHYCSWKQYAEGYRPIINGNEVRFEKLALANASKENFYHYLNLIYTYAGTQSLYDELPKVDSMADIEVGDMLIYPGSPGHVILVADMVQNELDKKLFIFAQGNTPAQSVHLLKNPNDHSLSPWYEIELGAYLEIPAYYFNEVKFMRFK